MSLWLWGVLGSPSPSGPSACCPEPWFCQGPRWKTPRTGAGLGWGLLRRCLWVTEAAPAPPRLWNEGSSVRPTPVCCTGFSLPVCLPSPLPEPRASLASAAPDAVRARGQGVWPGDPGPGPWAGPDLRTGMRAQQPALCTPPASPPLPHSQLQPSSCGGVCAHPGQVGGRLCQACVLSCEGACSCRPLPCRSQALRCLHTVPLCPHGRRRREAHRARGQAPALTLTLPAPLPLPEAAHLAYSALAALGAYEGRSPSPTATSLGVLSAAQGGGRLPIPAALVVAPALWHSFCRKADLGLHVRSHVPVLST